MDHRRRWCSSYSFTLQLVFLITAVLADEHFNTSPPPFKSKFSCYRRAPGFYADVDSNCKVYHTCDDYGNKFTYRCPEETAFRQDALICDHAHLVDCSATTYANIEVANGKQEEDESRTTLHRFQNSNTSNNARTFSRSFQVAQKPNKSISSKIDPGFVFSASVFLRDLDDGVRKLEPPENDNLRHTRTESALPDESINSHQANILPISSTIRPRLNHFGSTQESRNQYSNFPGEKTSFGSEDRLPAGRKIEFNSGKHEFFKDSGVGHRTSFGSGLKDSNLELDLLMGTGNRETSTNAYKDVKDSSKDFFKYSLHNNRDYPYLETLRSIQANSRPESSFTTIATTRVSPTTTTQLPINAFTASLKPLVPIGLEDDPYYPLFPSSTEAYYTPSHKDKNRPRTSTQPPWNTPRFQIPDVLPDLNTLEDLVDRRKFFYIPRIHPV